jgi:Endomembrane protein 70
MAMQEDIQEDWGWKLVHGEVFRTPRNPMLLSIMVGNGAQLCAMVGVTLGGPSMSCFNIINSVSTKISLRIVGFPFSIKSWFTWHCHDGVLDAVWRVSLPYPVERLASNIVLKQHWGLLFKSGVCLPGRYRTQEEFFPYSHCAPLVRSNSSDSSVSYSPYIGSFS